MKLMKDVSKRFLVLIMIFTMLIGLAQFGVQSNSVVTIPESKITQTYDLSNGSVTITVQERMSLLKALEVLHAIQ